MLDFKALLFDLDGTLLDTAPDFVTALNKQLARHGRAALPDSAIRTSVTNGSVGLIQSGFNIDPDTNNLNPYEKNFSNSILPIWRIKRHSMKDCKKSSMNVMHAVFPGALSPISPGAIPKQHWFSWV